MKSIFLTLIVSLILLNCQGQHTKAAAGGSSGQSSKGSSSTSTPASPAMPGFVYFLKHKEHIQYASSRIEIYTFTRGQLHKLPPVAEVLHIKANTEKRINDSFFLSRHVYSQMHTGFDAFPEYDLSSGKSDTVNLIDSAKGKVDVNEKDTLYQAIVIYYDSIPRFWDKERKWMFSRTRLRVSLSQDSLTLNAKLFYTNYNFTPRSDIKDVLNRAYRPKMVGIDTFGASKPKFPLQADSLLDKDDSVLADDNKDRKTQRQKSIVPTYGFAGSDHPIDTNFYRSKLWLYDTFYMAQYNLDLYQAQGASFQDTIRNLALFEDFDSLVKTRTLLDSMYTKGILKGKLLIYTHWKLANAPSTDPYAPLFHAAALVRHLRNLDIDSFKAPLPLPTDIFHKVKPEAAMSINADDSASNFYFAILPKTLLRDPMYYLKFHYAAWDYGTLAIPFRYRPPQSNGHILVNKDSASSAPSAADATINLSAYFGRKWGATRFYEDPSTTSDQVSKELVIFTGPTLIALSATNVDTSSRYMGYKNSYTYTGPANIIAWSFGVGGVLAFKGLTMGIFGGVDVPLVVKTGWVYRDKPWIGFGIGFNLGVLATGNSN